MRNITSPPSGLERVADGQGDAVPLLRFFLQLPLPLLRELVELRAAVVFGGSPCGREPARLFEPVQGGEQRPGLHLECAPGDVLDPARDAEAVVLAERECLEVEKVER